MSRVPLDLDGVDDAIDGRLKELGDNGPFDSNPAPANVEFRIALAERGELNVVRFVVLAEHMLGGSVETGDDGWNVLFEAGSVKFAYDGVRLGYEHMKGNGMVVTMKILGGLHRGSSCTHRVAFGGD